MSGYDFFSGFLGSLGQQMQDNQNRKRDIEDEERQYQRTLSREEALAKSRERLQIAAEERQRRNAAPTERVVTENGVQSYADQKWNPKKQAYETFGATRPVPDRVTDTRNVNGQVIRFYASGKQEVLGESDASLTRKSSDTRSANSVAARRSLQAERIEADRQIAGLKPATMPAGFAATVRDMYSPYAEKGDLGKAKLAAAAGIDPSLPPAQRDAAMMEVAKNQAISLLAPKAPDVMFRGSPAAEDNPAANIAAKIAEVKANDPSAKGATDAEIEAYLRAQGVIE